MTPIDQLNRKYAKPTVDVIFKKIFGSPGNENILKAFLSEVLTIQIESLTFENSELTKDLSSDKSVRLDVLAKLYSGEFVNIEVQVANKYNSQQRILYYWSKVFSQQIGSGGLFTDLKPVFSVFITEYVCYPNDDRYLRNFLIFDKETREPLSQAQNLLHLCFVELPKFKRQTTMPTQKLDQWILFLKSDNDEILEELKMRDDNIFKAVSSLELAGMNQQERHSYEATLEGHRNFMSGLEGSRLEGFHKARLETLQRQSSKRFPNLPAAIQSKIFMLNDNQLNQMLDMMLDFQNQSEFEEAIDNLCSGTK